MQRILVVGSPGAGKSTLARAVARRLDLPLIHLDRHYWGPGWVASDEARFRAEVAGLADRPAWVMDGNYGSTLDLRLPRADVLVLCDPPRLVCLARVLRRHWANRATRRPDLPDGCPEQIDLEFLRYVWHFPRRSRPRVIAALAAVVPRPTVVRLRSGADVRRWLDTLPPS
ncbi:MAG: AAA family ATPase [Micromonospora sp.]